MVTYYYYFCIIIVLPERHDALWEEECVVANPGRESIHLLSTMYHSSNQGRNS